MAVKVLIPPPLRPHAGGQVAAEFPARNVAEALDRLTSEFADLKRHLFTEEGRLRSFVNVYVNGEDIRYLAEEKTPTKDGDTINIIPSIAGGNVGGWMGRTGRRRQKRQQAGRRYTRKER